MTLDPPETFLCESHSGRLSQPPECRDCAIEKRLTQQRRRIEALESRLAAWRATMSDTEPLAIEHTLPLGVGAVFGVLGAVWSYYEARAAVKVRPRLNDVGFIDAMLTGHGVDWLFLYYPMLSAVAWIVLLSVWFWVAVRLKP